MALQFRWLCSFWSVIPAKAGSQAPTVSRLDHLNRNAVLRYTTYSILRRELGIIAVKFHHNRCPERRCEPTLSAWHSPLKEARHDYFEAADRPKGCRQR